MTIRVDGIRQITLIRIGATAGTRYRIASSRTVAGWSARGRSRTTAARSTNGAASSNRLLMLRRLKIIAAAALPLRAGTSAPRCRTIHEVRATRVSA